MHENAPFHAAIIVKFNKEERRIPILEWPAYSVDPNPIEIVWNWIKDYVKNFSPERMSCDEFTIAVTGSWEAVPENWTHHRC